MDRIIQALHFDGQNIADIFKLSCVTSIRKSYPNLVFATVLCYDGVKRVVRKGDWIVEVRSSTKNGWQVLSNKEYKSLHVL